MTQTPTTPNPELSSSNLPQPPVKRSRSVLVLIFRLLLLGVGGTVAVLAGVAIAHYYPAQSKDMPLMEKVLQSSRSLLIDIQRLPQTWQGQRPASPAPATENSGSSTTATAPSRSTASIPLSATERQKLEDEVSQIEQTLQQLNNRTVAIESRLGTANTQASLEARLKTIQAKLNPNATSSANPTAPESTGIAPAPATTTLTQDDRLLVTLPSDALFETNQTALKPGTETILDSIVEDLKRYPGATIRVTAHLDEQGSEDADRARSFEQAKAVEQYLGGKLKEGYHWLVEGYGHSRPVITNDSAVNRQRNRRIEIVIEPK